MITITNNGTKLLVSIDKNQLKLLPTVANHSFFSNEANWYKVSVVLKNTVSSARMVATFFSDFTQQDEVTLRVGTKIGDNYEVHRIIISSASKNVLLSIPKSQIPNSSSMNVALTANGGYSLPQYPRVSLTSSSVESVNSKFTVYATFTTAVSGFSAEDIIVSNATVQLFTTTNPNIYEIEVTPILPGAVTVRIPANVAFSSADYGNTSSLPFSVEYTTNSTSLSDSYRYYMFAFKDGWNFTSDSSSYKIGFSCLQMVWDDKIQTLDQSCLTYLKEPTSATKHLLDESYDSLEHVFFDGLNIGYYNNLFKIDLGQERNVTAVFIRPQSLQGYPPKSFKIYASNDNQTWMEIFSNVETINTWSHGYTSKAFVIKKLPKQFLLDKDSNWSVSENWSPKMYPNSNDSTAILCSNNDNNGLAKLDTDITLNKLIIYGAGNWTITTDLSKKLILDGINPSINILSTNFNGWKSILTPLQINSDCEITGKSKGYLSLNGQITAENKTITISVDSNKDNNWVYLSNQNNNISGKIIVDTQNASIRNTNSQNCTLEWSNKKGTDTAHFPQQGTPIVIEQSMTKLYDLKWEGPIVFKNDGNKKYSIDNETLTTYNGNFSGDISKGLHLKNCKLNAQNFFASLYSGNIFVTEGTLELNHIYALPQFARIHVGKNEFLDSPNHILIKLPQNSNVSHGITYYGPSGFLYDWNLLAYDHHFELDLNNSYLIGGITFVKSTEPVIKKVIKVVNSGHIGGISGDGSDSILRTVTPNSQIILFNNDYSTQHYPKVEVTNQSTVTIHQNSIKILSQFEVSNGSTLGLSSRYTGTGPVTIKNSGAPSLIYGNGTIEGNLILETSASLSPSNLFGVESLEYVMSLTQRYYGSNPSYYGLTVNGNFTCNSGSKIKFDFKDNTDYFYQSQMGPMPGMPLFMVDPSVLPLEASRIVVNGDVVLNGTIEAGEHLPISMTPNATGILLQYTGTRTGTFVNNFGPGITIIYDDVNKRVLIQT